MRVRRRVLVSGRVQGVFFRDECRHQALSRDVAGWVRNRPDGRVEAVFEGEPDAVDHLVSWCRVGPRSARVGDVETFSEEPGDETGFRVL